MVKVCTTGLSLRLGSGVTREGVVCELLCPVARYQLPSNRHDIISPMVLSLHNTAVAQPQVWDHRRLFYRSELVAEYPARFHGLLAASLHLCPAPGNPRCTNHKHVGVVTGRSCQTSQFKLHECITTRMNKHPNCSIVSEHNCIYHFSYMYW